MSPPRWVPLALLLCVVSCKTTPAPPSEQTMLSPQGGAPPWATLESCEPVDPSVQAPLEVVAEEGQPPDEAPEVLPRPPTQPLSAAQLAALTKRPPPLAGGAGPGALPLGAVPCWLGALGGRC